MEIYVANMNIFFNDHLYNQGEEIPNPTKRMIELGVVYKTEKIELNLLFDNSSSVNVT